MIVLENEITSYQNILSDIRSIINSGRNSAYATANSISIMTYWNIGKRIVENEQEGEKRAEYGKKLTKKLAEDLSKEFGNSYSQRNLEYYRKFYILFNDLEILNACVQNLNWTHFRSLLRVSDENARIWYMNEAIKESWSARTLDRNVGTQYYNRLLKAPQKELVIQEMLDKTAQFQSNNELIKNPIIAEFLGFKTEDAFLESELENAIITHIRDFLMELGRGFAFVARQQHIQILRIII